VQARALLEAAAGRTLSVMFPMVSEPWEFAEARALMEAQRERLQASGRPVPSAIQYGAMIEVPALIEQLDVLLPMVDFVSIGTNDLTQFLFAADRANPKLAERYDWLSPSILRFLRRVMVNSVGSGVDIGVCGEMGGRTLEAMALLALGIFATAYACAGIGMLVAAFSKTLDNFAAIMNFVIFPVFFLSGSLYPVGNLPWLLGMAAHLNPYTYGVDLLKHALPQAAGHTADFAVTIDVAVLAGFSLLAFAVSAWRFSREQAYAPLFGFGGPKKGGPGGKPVGGKPSDGKPA
jgi:ABC-type polysaccharide/polyol phosphate export permease